MIIIEFGKDLFHDGLSEKGSLGIDSELLTILRDCSHLTVIQIDDLPVLAHKGCLLLFQIFRIYA